MVKGISRQVIVVHAPDPQLFEQAIFILKDGTSRDGLTDEALLREAQRAIHAGDHPSRHRKFYYYGFFWACIGAFAVGAAWLISSL